MNMAAAFSSLQEWTENFIKHKDAFEKKIKKISPTKTGFLVEYAAKAQEYTIAEPFTHAFEKKASRQDTHAQSVQRTIVCENTKENVKSVVKDWKLLMQPLTILFVNLKSGEKWSLNPKLHSLVADDATLEAGLLKMMDTANGVEEKEKPRKKRVTMFEESGEKAGGDGDGGTDLVEDD